MALVVLLGWLTWYALGHRPVARDGAPAWSPAGTAIVFDAEQNGRRDIVVMNSDGTNVHPLTNIEGADEFLKWATSTDCLYAFGKEWLNPVPRASAIDLISADAAISDADKAAIAAFATSAAAGKSMTMVPQYSQLLDVLGIMQSGVMSKAMTIDQALADGQTRAEAAMAS